MITIDPISVGALGVIILELQRIWSKLNDINNSDAFRDKRIDKLEKRIEMLEERI